VSFGAAAIVLLRCEPPAVSQRASAPVETVEPVAHGDACANDKPDCVAACALRESHRTEFLDFYDRRCAAVVLGKNPDKVPQPTAATEEPAECKASRTLRAIGREPEADLLTALCAAKGGNAGDPDAGPVDRSRK
jgi:hypothetical protein